MPHRIAHTSRRTLIRSADLFDLLTGSNLQQAENTMAAAIRAIENDQIADEVCAGSSWR